MDSKCKGTPTQPAPAAPSKLDFVRMPLLILRILLAEASIGGAGASAWCGAFEPLAELEKAPGPARAILIQLCHENVPDMELFQWLLGIKLSTRHQRNTLTST